MKLGSLFSGAAGLDRAVEQVFGARTVWHSEMDPAASKVLAQHFPGIPNHGDITAIDWAAVEPVDILCGGWPCQPFSLAGKRKGAADERALWPYVAGAIRLVRPRIVVLENVPAVVGPELQRVADSLAEVGYDLRWTCIRASDVGAAHRRERLFIVAIDTCRDGRGGYPQRDSEPIQPEFTTPLRGDADRCCDNAVALLPTPAAARSGRNQSPSPGAAIRPSLDMITELLPTPRRSDGDGDGGPNPLHRAERMDDVETRVIRIGSAWGKYEPAIRRWEQATRPAPSPTEPNRNGKPRLNPAFSEWMLGWPEGWVTAVPGISRNGQLRIVGNGVVSLQAAHALRWLLRVSEMAA